MTLPNDEQAQALYPQDVSVALDEMLYDQNLMVPNQEAAAEVSLEEQALNAQAVRDQHAYELDVRQREIEKVLVQEEILPSSHVDSFDFSGALMALLTITIIVGLAYLAQKQIAAMSTKPTVQSGVVIEHPANLPVPVPAYPTVRVRESSDPSQAPSPLPLNPPAQQN
jgi:hypothetical protein